MITIDLGNIFSPISVIIDKHLSVVQFQSPQKTGDSVLIHVRISPHSDKLLPGVYNLALGPLKTNGKIDDNVRLKHTDPGKVFSTAILFALTFLSEYPDLTIGLDGSDDLRATLYHSMFLTNRKQLNQHFIAIGVDWYVKLLRNQLEIERKEDGTPFFKPRPEPFDYSRTRHDLYRYYMFHLKSKV